jgi:hypothetical protein
VDPDAALIAVALLAWCAGARADDALRNGFDDPFFKVTAALPGCPEPAGPRVTAAERQAQSHRRAEKGTTCWLARETGCERASAYAYDRDIAAAVQRALQADAQAADTTLWVTVQGRVVYVEGCVARQDQAAAIERTVRALPHVQQAFAIVRVGGSGSPPYRRWCQGPAR